MLFVRLSDESLPPSSGGEVLLLAPSHVLWVVLQTGDELFHLFAFKADLVDCREQREPAEDIQFASEPETQQGQQQQQQTDV